MRVVAPFLSGHDREVIVICISTPSLFGLSNVLLCRCPSWLLPIRESVDLWATFFDWYCYEHSCETLLYRSVFNSLECVSSKDISRSYIDTIFNFLLVPRLFSTTDQPLCIQKPYVEIISHKLCKHLLHPLKYLKFCYRHSRECEGNSFTASQYGSGFHLPNYKWHKSFYIHFWSFSVSSLRNTYLKSLTLKLVYLFYYY